MNSRDSFTLRFVRVWINEKKTEYEILATNLPRDLFPKECFGELYQYRWQIETAFETLRKRYLISASLSNRLNCKNPFRSCNPATNIITGNPILQKSFHTLVESNMGLAF